MSVPECKRVLALLTKHLKQDLSAERKNKIEAHLNECGSCRLAYSSAQETLDGIERGWPAPLSGDRQAERCKENDRAQSGLQKSA